MRADKARRAGLVKFPSTEAFLDHSSYHAGELAILRQAVNDWT